MTQKIMPHSKMAPTFSNMPFLFSAAKAAYHSHQFSTLHRPALHIEIPAKLTRISTIKATNVSNRTF